MERLRDSAEDVYDDDAHSVDAYSSVMSSSQVASEQWTILDEKRNRKQLEEDAMRLRNRVRTLEKEERRVRQQISQTVEQIESAVRIKEDRDRRETEKEIRKAQQRRNVMQRRAKNAQSRLESQKARRERESQIHEEKMHLAQETKSEKAKHRRACVQDRDVQLKKAQERKAGVKRIEDDIKKKLDMHKQNKLSKAQEDYERRLVVERQARKDKEQELAELMQMELVLIDKLKTKQHEQERHYQKLKQCIKAKNLNEIPRSTSSLDKQKKGQIHQLAKEQSVNDRSASEKHRPKVLQLLQQYDPEESGLLITTDLHSVLAALDAIMDESQVAEMLCVLDPLKTGCIAHSDFVKWWKGHKASKLLHQPESLHKDQHS